MLIANTSGRMPVARRKHDLGDLRNISVTWAIKSPSYWRTAHPALVRALRGWWTCLEEMPGEGYPACLSAVRQVYDAGSVKALGGDGREGAVSAIGAVSHSGGDISKEAGLAGGALRIVKVFLGAEQQALCRHFPAIDGCRAIRARCIWIASKAGS